MATFTMGELRAATESLPDNAQIFAECGFIQFDVERVLAIGQATDDPGLAIKLGPPMQVGVSDG